jgi:sarcosine oxidase gamma subunit
LPRFAQHALVLGVTLMTVHSTWRPQPKACHGFSEAVATIWSAEDTQKQAVAAEKTALPEPSGRWLVASDARGEGAFIAAAAFRLSRPVPARLQVLRGSKELAETDWISRNYQFRFANDAALLQHLDAAQVRWIVVDLSVPEDLVRPHESRLRTALESAPDRWTLFATQPVQRSLSATSGKLLIFHRKPTDAP